MFSNFIYFIIVLLIYTTYQPSEETGFTPLETVSLFFLLIGIFSCITWMQFRKLQYTISYESISRLNHKFHAILAQQSMMAIVLFAIDIYGLNLTSFFINAPPFSVIPTLQALLFLGLFVFYLAIVWACAHGTYQRVYLTDLSRRSYILSQISFSIPVILPWLMLSGIADIINALPFEQPKRFLSTTEGEMLYFLIFLVGIAIIGPAMIQKLWRCKPLESGYYRSRIETLCKKGGLEYANILYWPIFGSRMITAGVMGLVKKFRYILVTDALLRLLAPEEIDAVIAHEIGHIKRKHLLFYLVFFVGYMLITYAFFNLTIYSIIYAEPIYRFVNYIGFNQITVTSALFSFVAIVFFIIYFRYIFGFFMRNFERQADTYVYTFSKSAQPLISTFEKIAITSGQPPDKPSWHHFSIKKRIEYLKKCETDKTWITRHDQKVKKSIAVYLVGIFLIGSLGYNLNFGETGKRLNKHFFEKILLREIDRAPDNPNLYSALGDLYYSNKNYAETIKAYEHAINISPDNPHALNNLAWLYATCDEKRFRDPIQAVELAQKAAERKKAPHILDTLAESYYVTGLFEEAVSAEKRALERVGKNRHYYENQLNKFLEAAKKVP